MAFLGVFHALYDYVPQSHEELAIKDGDLLLKLPDDDDDGQWIRVKLKAKSDDEEEPEGLVPANYVEEAAVLYKAKALYDYERQTEEELSFEEGKFVEVYDITDEDWTLVGDRATGTYGFAPAIYIEKVAVGANGVAPTRELAPPPMPTRPQMPAEPTSLPPSSGYGPIPGEVDYVAPQQSPTSPSNPASALASIIAQRTGGSAPAAASQREVNSPPLPTRPQQQYDEPYYEEEPEPPPKPARPQSQAIPPPIAPPLPTQSLSYSPREPQLSPGVMTSSPHNREVARSQAVPAYDDDAQLRSPGGFHLYNVHEMVSHMGKNRKMGCTLGINLAVGIITLSPEKSRDGPTQEWTADKLTHYSIEGKHVFMNLVRPSKDLDLHAGAKDTAKEIVSMLGELAGAVRAGSQGLSEIMGASRGGQRIGKMLYEFMAQGEDEVTVAVGDEVIVVDSEKSDEWWQVKRVKNGKEGVVPSSYVELTGTIGTTGGSAVPGYTTAKDRVEENRKEEERLAKQAAKSSVPDRSTSLHARTSSRQNGSRSERSSATESSKTKSKPRQEKIRTWTDRTGTFKVDAEFVGLRDGKIHLHKINGVKIAVPVTKMSVEDLEFVEKATGQSLDEDKPLSDIKRKSTLKAKESRSSDRAQKSGASVQKDDGYDWFDFFLQVGCNPQICERYAHAFSRDQMSPEILPEVNEQLLRTLGLKEGDILRVMKFLDAKYDRKHAPTAIPAAATGDDTDQIEPANGGGLFSGPTGALRNNTRKGRPAPAVATSDTVSADALRSGTASPAVRSPSSEAPVAKAPERSAVAATGFDDDAWDVRPSKTATAQPTPVAEPPRPIEPPKPRINDDIASLSITSPPLQPTPSAPAPAPPPTLTQTPTAPPQISNPPLQESQQLQGANAEIFNKIASLAPARQRPQPPPQTMNNQGLAPPPRAASAPGFNPQQNGFGQPPLHQQLTGVQYPPQTGFGGSSNLMMPQSTGFPNQQPQQFSGGFQPGLSAFSGPQQSANNLQGLQTNFPSLVPQSTGFGAQQYQQQLAQQRLQNQQTGFGMQAPQQQYLGGQPTGFANGQQTGSPFADPPRQPFQPAPSNLQSSFMPQPTGYGAQQPGFQYSVPTGAQNGTFGQQAPQLPPQQTGGVFGPGAPTGMSHPPAAPLIAQKTGPAPPVRFGVQEQAPARPLTAQKTGADLRRATPQNPFGF
ncbi:hypothetical protein K431DRAFT_287925 [Polychaeton citri CBS 116435]|uniref:Actin cytoskeleton-regulatory complex protein SLA1 n=1 Tax=Polychaeton citri CBS 116435 TaxID=1314669 RepID=A0A9P4Q4B7_9PEZI|nr:hypothetical protein K431DRAFT_287925 [Polychaeton citri CBS 116435]